MDESHICIKQFISSTENTRERIREMFRLLHFEETNCYQVGEKLWLWKFIIFQIITVFCNWPAINVVRHCHMFISTYIYTRHRSQIWGIPHIKYMCVTKYIQSCQFNVCKSNFALLQRLSVKAGQQLWLWCLQKAPCILHHIMENIFWWLLKLIFFFVENDGNL